MVNIKNLVDFHYSSSISIGLFSDQETRPSTYLQYAADDLRDPDSERTRINALGNAKRALHLQVERLSDVLGFARWRPNDLGMRGFPRRLKFAELCGTITPRILDKVNRLRNAMEHEYATPNRELVEDYVDVVELYVGASDRFVTSFPHGREVYAGPSFEERETFCLWAVAQSGKILVYNAPLMDVMRAIPNVDPGRPWHCRTPDDMNPTESVDIEEDGDEYFEWVRLVLDTRGAS